MEAPEPDEFDADLAENSEPEGEADSMEDPDEEETDGSTAPDRQPA